MKSGKRKIRETIFAATWKIWKNKKDYGGLVLVLLSTIINIFCVKQQYLERSQTVSWSCDLGLLLNDPSSCFRIKRLVIQMQKKILG